MTKTVRALIVPADESIPVTVETITGDHATLKTLVSDYNTDTLFLAGVAAVAVCAASGKSNKPVNPRATTLAEQFLPGFAKRDRLHGDVVLLGLDTKADDPDEAFADVPGPLGEAAATHFTVLGQ